MLALLKLAPQLAAIARVLHSHPLPARYLVKGNVISSDVYRAEYNLDFFRVHEGHDLAIRSEYGAYVDRCGEWFRCPSCDRNEHCILPKEHQGEHSNRERPTP